PVLLAGLLPRLAVLLVLLVLVPGLPSGLLLPLGARLLAVLLVLLVLLLAVALLPVLLAHLLLAGLALLVPVVGVALRHLLLRALRPRGLHGLEDGVDVPAGDADHGELPSAEQEHRQLRQRARGLGVGEHPAEPGDDPEHADAGEDAERPHGDVPGLRRGPVAPRRQEDGEDDDRDDPDPEEHPVPRLEQEAECDRSVRAQERDDAREQLDARRREQYPGGRFAQALDGFLVHGDISRPRQSDYTPKLGIDSPRHPNGPRRAPRGGPRIRWNHEDRGAGGRHRRGPLPARAAVGGPR